MPYEPCPYPANHMAIPMDDLAWHHRYLYPKTPQPTDLLWHFHSHPLASMPTPTSLRPVQHGARLPRPLCMQPTLLSLAEKTWPRTRRHENARHDKRMARVGTNPTHTDLRLPTGQPLHHSSPYPHPPTLANTAPLWTMADHRNNHHMPLSTNQPLVTAVKISLRKAPYPEKVGSATKIKTQ
jgi:hypothetical protein